MSQRRDRPAVQRSGSSIEVRLPDGRTMSMPTGVAPGSVTTDPCCFCGEDVEHATDERIRLSVRFVDDGSEGEQSWAAHRACLEQRMHERVKGTGPFFRE